MKVLSVKNPWAWLICANIKPIENRTWKCPEKYIGQRILIHSSGIPDKEPYKIFTGDQAELIFEGEDVDTMIHVFDSYKQTSRIIGSVEIVDCVPNHESIWAQHTAIKKKKISGEIFMVEVPVYNWVLANPILFDNPIENVKGKLSFWDYELSEEAYLNTFSHESIINYVNNNEQST